MENTLVTLTSPEGAILETKNLYCDKNIEIVPALQSKTATTGEIVTADDGYVGLSEVDTNPAFEAGFKTWMDAYIGTGNRNAQGLFSGSGWTVDTFKPTRDIADFWSAHNMFWGSKIKGDLVEILDNLGVALDFSNCANFTQAFFITGFTRIGVVNATKDASFELTQTFQYSSSLQKIDKVCVTERVSYNHTFTQCSALEDLTIEGTIGQNGFNVSWSPLSKASLISVINALSTTTTGLTVTLRLAAVNTAFETTAGAADGSTSDEWLALADSKPNWTINLIDS